MKIRNREIIKIRNVRDKDTDDDDDDETEEDCAWKVRRGSVKDFWVLKLFS